MCSGPQLLDLIKNIKHSITCLIDWHLVFIGIRLIVFSGDKMDDRPLNGSLTWLLILQKSFIEVKPAALNIESIYVGSIIGW